MAAITPGPGAGDGARADLDRELRRVCDRLRTLALPRLRAPLAGAPVAGVSVAAGVRALAQRLADTAGGIEAREGAREPTRRLLPVLRDHALADQLRVTGTDVLLAVDGLADDVAVWDGAVRRPLGEVLADAHRAVVTLRRALP